MGQGAAAVPSVSCTTSSLESSSVPPLTTIAVTPGPWQTPLHIAGQPHRAARLHGLLNIMFLKVYESLDIVLELSASYDSDVYDYF